MKAIIIEDEKHSAKGLARMLKSIDDGIEILEFIDSVEGAVQFFNNCNSIDLVFMDIQLSDGQCFEIFNQVEIETPVIFTTSYNEFAIKAFEFNSIDYLLKPILPNALAKSMAKFKKVNEKKQNVQIASLLQYLNIPTKPAKNRFLVKAGKSLKPIVSSDIAFFSINEQLLFLYTFDGYRHMINGTLDSLTQQLNTEIFFRINRQTVVNKQAVNKIHAYFNSTLKLDLKVSCQNEFIVSRSLVKDFKDWMEK